MQNKLPLFLAFFLLVAPLWAKEKPKARRYTMKDIDKRETKITKLDQWMQVVATLGLIAVAPGTNVQIKSSNANVQINRR